MDKYMYKEQMLRIAERNLRKAKKALENNRKRNGVTEDELENLLGNVKYAQVVYHLIANSVNDDYKEEN